MPSPARSALPRRFGFAPILLANLIPLVGVVRFGWSSDAIVAIYAIEVVLSFLLAGAKALVAALAVKVAGLYLRYGPLEYRRYGDRLVAYDTFLDEPQWSAPLGEVRDVSVVRNRLPDRIFGSRTFEVTTGWGEEETDRRLCSVADPEAAVAAFELGVDSVELEPLDGRVAAVAALLGRRRGPRRRRTARRSGGGSVVVDARPGSVPAVRPRRGGRLERAYRNAARS